MKEITILLIGLNIGFAFATFLMWLNYTESMKKLTSKIDSICQMVKHE